MCRSMMSGCKALRFVMDASYFGVTGRSIKWRMDANAQHLSLCLSLRAIALCLGYEEYNYG